MTEMEAREALANWATQHKQRDTIIRGAVAAGVTKYQVHQITGLARTTIDSILANGGAMKTYRIYFASGDPLREGSQDQFTAAEAADLVAAHPWAWTDRDGDIIVNTYRTRCGADEHKPIKGHQMAARLRRGEPS